MRKVDDGEKKKKKRKEKIMSFLVATKVVASRPPKRRTTGTPHARANIISCCLKLLQFASVCSAVIRLVQNCLTK